MKLPQRGGEGRGRPRAEGGERLENQLLKNPGENREDQKPEDGSCGPAKEKAGHGGPDNKIQNSLAIKYKHAMFLPWVREEEGAQE